MDGASKDSVDPFVCWQDFAAVITEMEGVFFLAIPAKLQVIFLVFFPLAPLPFLSFCGRETG